LRASRIPPELGSDVAVERLLNFGGERDGASLGRIEGQLLTAGVGFTAFSTLNFTQITEGLKECAGRVDQWGL